MPIPAEQGGLYRPSDWGRPPAKVKEARYGGESSTDPRLVKYIEALRNLDMGQVLAIRQAHINNEPLTRRFDTVDASIKGILDLYILEIEILNLEAVGWKNICESKSRMACTRLSKRAKAAALQFKYKGERKLKQASLLRKKMQ